MFLISVCGYTCIVYIICVVDSATLSSRLNALACDSTSQYIDDYLFLFLFFEITIKWFAFSADMAGAT